MRVCSHRPPFLHLALFFAAYMLGCGFAKVLAIVPGITVSIWPPGGVFVATLILAPIPTWPWWILVGCLAEMFAQFLWFASPPLAGLLIYAGNAMAAATGAWLMNRVCGRPVRLETLREVLAFVVLCAGIAPLVSATVGSASLAWFGVKNQTFTGVWPLFWIGDATGVLLVAPLALVVLQNWRNKTELSAAQWMEAGVLGLIFLGVAALSMSNHYLPFAYIVMPPLLWAAVRFEFKGVAVALSLLALITAALTISGASQFVVDPESQRQRQIMLQLFLAISAFSALIVAAISRQHQQALVTLRESERQLQQLIDAVPAAIARRSPDGDPTFFNKRMVDFLGLDVAETDKPGMSRMAVVSQKFIHPDDASGVKAALTRSFAAGQSYSHRYRLRRADGAYRWMETREEPLRDQRGEIAQWYSISIDVEDEVRAHEALRNREREFSQIVAMVPSLLWRVTPNGEPTFFNKRTVDFLGREVADYDKPGMSRLAATIEAISHPDDANGLMDALNYSFATGESFSMRYRLRRMDGVYRWMSGRAEPLRDESGIILQWYGLAHDIDDEVRALEALRDRERELSQLVDMVPVHIRRLTPEGKTIFFNKRLVDFVGMDLAELGKLGMSGLAGTIQTFIHPDDVAGLSETIGNSLVSGEGYAAKYRVRRADGVYRWMEGRGEPLRDQSGAIVQWYGISIDIDDEMRAQQAEEALRHASDRLVQATQAASLAELSASIAHEVNQPLAAIVANSHACQRWLTAEPPNLERAQKTAERIIGDANAASEVVSRIRALFSQMGKSRSPADITHVIAEVRRLLADELSAKHIRMETEFDGSLPPAMIDRVQMQQVLVNLIRNAIDATDTIRDSTRLIRIRAVLDGNDAIRVEVADFGTGMKDFDRVFEPFFTTKANGMGMGLAICRSIIESHDGRLWATENQPSGTTFSFTLPIRARDAA